MHCGEQTALLRPPTPAGHFAALLHAGFCMHQEFQGKLDIRLKPSDIYLRIGMWKTTDSNSTYESPAIQVGGRFPRLHCGG